MTFLAKYREAGLLILRLSLGLFFIWLAAPVLFHGRGAWAHFAAPVHHLGVRSHLEWWGFCGALLQTIGGCLLIAGLFFRLGLLFILIWVIFVTMALWHHGGLQALTSLELCIILSSLLFVGPGKFSVDKT